MHHVIVRRAPGNDWSDVLKGNEDPVHDLRDARAALHTKASRTFIWVIVLSLGFYGVKGGIYTLLHGGTGKVYGPGGFLEGNNELALALVMCIPLVFYLRSMATRTWMRHGFTLAMLLMALSILGSQSRGALLAIIAMAAYLWRHSERKVIFAIALVLLALGFLAFMPDAWEARMHTITSYERDGSAMGRINSWWMAWNLAKDRFVGGGFEVATPDLFCSLCTRPDPPPRRPQHLLPGAWRTWTRWARAVPTLLWLFTWRMAGGCSAAARNVPELEWAGRLAGMVQVSFVGYAVGGAFLSLAYFDLPYDLMIVL
jgi:hypothetical protein